MTSAAETRVDRAVALDRRLRALGVVLDAVVAQVLPLTREHRALLDELTAEERLAYLQRALLDHAAERGHAVDREVPRG